MPEHKVSPIQTVLLCLLLLLLTAGLSSCGQKPAEEQDDPSLQDYGRIMSSTLKETREQEVLLPLQQAINSFQAIEDRYPDSLEELVRHGYLNNIPSAPGGKKFTYDQTTGILQLE